MKSAIVIALLAGAIFLAPTGAASETCTQQGQDLETCANIGINGDPTSGNWSTCPGVRVASGTAYYVVCIAEGTDSSGHCYAVTAGGTVIGLQRLIKHCE